MERTIDRECVDSAKDFLIKLTKGLIEDLNSENEFGMQMAYNTILFIKHFLDANRKYRAAFAVTCCNNEIFEKEDREMLPIGQLHPIYEWDEECDESCDKEHSSAESLFNLLIERLEKNAKKRKTT